MTGLKKFSNNVVLFRTDPAAHQPSDVGDLRFRKLLTTERWNRLPAAVRARFSKKLTGNRVAVFTGEIIETRISRLGWIFAQAARLVGAPLPISRDINVPAVVSVTEDETSGGQFWTRLYNHHNGFPQVIHSAKRFAGPTGLEEYIGFGIGMALTVAADDTTLYFRSAHYFLKIGTLRLQFPRWLTPGQTLVSHVDMGHGAFAFVLNITHPIFGELVHQLGLFKDA
jgi:hypothetical protein